MKGEAVCAMATELLDANELARRLGVRPSTIREWGRSNRIPKRRLSYKVIRYELAEVVRALETSQSPAAAGGVFQ